MIPATKCHGSGNDFVLIEETGLEFGDDRAALVRQICDRTGPLGADGVLFVNRPGPLPRMRIFNADGSEAEMCGNGLRCVGRYLLEAEGVDALDVATMRETLHVQRRDPLHPGVESVGYHTSAISFDARDLPMTRGPSLIDGLIPELHPTLTFTALAAPNPHLVTFVEEVDLGLLAEVGERIKTATALFPQGSNVSFAERLGDAALFVATYERGVGLTNACGTAMTASCVAAVEQGRLDRRMWIDVFTPGGKVRCRVDTEGDRFVADLVGNATFVYDTELSLVDGQLEQSLFVEVQPRVQEIDAYAELERSAKTECAALRSRS